MQVVGKVKEFGYADQPSILELVGAEPHPRKAEIIAYLKRGKIVSACPSIWKDVFTGEKINGEELMLSDGKYAWRSDVVHYVDKYNLSLPDEFVEHVLTDK